MTDVTLASRGRRLRAYLRVPDGQGPWPGVVVLHDALGQTADSRRQADWLAASGYLAIAPDLYSRGARLFCIWSVTRNLMTGQGAAFDDIEAARSALVARGDCTGAVGVIGFCLGGGFALLAAKDRGFTVSSVNYGSVPPETSAALKGTCPIVGSFGGRDYTLRGAAARLKSALEANDAEYDVKEYPDAGHEFLNSHDGAVGWVMARIGMRYDVPVADDARKRIIFFFRRYLS